MMYSSIALSLTNFKQNETFFGELLFENDSMRKVNINKDISSLFYKIPTILIVILVNSTSVILFRSLEANFAYKMIIYDCVNNILYVIALFYGSNFSLPFPPFCGLSVALSYGFITFNRLVPLVIVLYRYAYNLLFL